MDVPQKSRLKKIVTFAGFGSGGSASALLSLLNNVNRNEWNILVLVPRKCHLTDHLDNLAIPYSLMGHKPSGRCAQLLWLWRIFKTVRNYKPDLIHSNISVDVYGYLLSLILRIPHVWHLREYADGIGGMNIYRMFGRDKMKRILANKTYSISVARGLSRYFDIEFNTRNKVIYDGIKLSLDIPDTTRNGDFLFVGEVCEYKGVTDLIEAFVMFCKSDTKCRLTLVGNVDDNYKNLLLSICAGTSAEKRICFKGYSRNVREYMQHYSTIIVPSHTEAFGLVMAEAMTNKCLVIARNIDGLKEQFDNGLNEHGDEIGLRFDTSHQLFMRMKESIVMTTEQRQAMIKRAYETVSKLYAEERCACETFLFFNNCITRDKHGVK